MCGLSFLMRLFTSLSWYVTAMPCVRQVGAGVQLCRVACIAYALHEKSEGASSEKVLLGLALRGFSSPLSLMALPRDEYLRASVYVADARLSQLTWSMHIRPRRTR